MLFAVKGGHVNAVKTLIKHNVDVSILDKDYNYPMCYAIFQERVDIFRVSSRLLLVVNVYNF